MRGLEMTAGIEAGRSVGDARERAVVPKRREGEKLEGCEGRKSGGEMRKRRLIALAFLYLREPADELS